MRGRGGKTKEEKKDTGLKEIITTPILRDRELANGHLAFYEGSSSNHPTTPTMTSKVENLKLRIVYKEKPNETSDSSQASESKLNSNVISKPEPEPEPEPTSLVSNTEPESSQKIHSSFSLYQSLLEDETPFKKCFIESWSEEERRSLIQKDTSLRSLINRGHR